MKKWKVVTFIAVFIAMVFVLTACPHHHHRRRPRRVIVVPFAQVLPDRPVIVCDV